MLLVYIRYSHLVDREGNKIGGMHLVYIRYSHLVDREGNKLGGMHLVYIRYSHLVDTVALVKLHLSSQTVNIYGRHSGSLITDPDSFLS